ncbi:MAG: branched-chain amino acid ABC transporter permease [Hyphomicrobiales bacterium]|nr:branched-chain amino acid ABC transporter permease [Hyphomicrobiales bacterium]
MIRDLAAAMSVREAVAAAALALLLLAAPWIVGDYVLSVILIILYFAYVGQAWNLMMGIAGQLSLGHALYVGLGAYTAAVLFVHFDVPPAIGLFAAMAIAALAGAIIGYLAFRFGISGVYFALLTIAFAEFTRILFSHFEWVGATSGFFLPVENRTSSDLVNLRGSPVMFYYVILALAAGALIFVRLLAGTRLGYYWRAIREDQIAAQALGINVFRYKMLAVVISAAMTAVGGVFLAFYYNNLFPTDVFGIHRSIEIILAPIIGGLGTYFGPVIGAFLIGTLGEVLTAATEAAGAQTAGIKQLVYGVILLVIIKLVPGGLWPLIARSLGFGKGERK